MPTHPHTNSTNSRHHTSDPPALSPEIPTRKPPETTHEPESAPRSERTPQNHAHPQHNRPRSSDSIPPHSATMPETQLEQPPTQAVDATSRESPRPRWESINTNMFPTIIGGVVVAMLVYMLNTVDTRFDTIDARLTRIEEKQDVMDRTLVALVAVLNTRAEVDAALAGQITEHTAWHAESDITLAPPPTTSCGRHPVIGL